MALLERYYNPLFRSPLLPKNTCKSLLMWSIGKKSAWQYDSIKSTSVKWFCNPSDTSLKKLEQLRWIEYDCLLATSTPQIQPEWEWPAGAARVSLFPVYGTVGRQESSFSQTSALGRPASVPTGIICWRVVAICLKNLCFKSDHKPWRKYNCMPRWVMCMCWSSCLVYLDMTATYHISY